MANKKKSPAFQVKFAIELRTTLQRLLQQTGMGRTQMIEWACKVVFLGDQFWITCEACGERIATFDTVEKENQCFNCEHVNGS